VTGEPQLPKIKRGRLTTLGETNAAGNHNPKVNEIGQVNEIDFEKRQHINFGGFLR